MVTSLLLFRVRSKIGFHYYFMFFNIWNACRCVQNSTYKIITELDIDQLMICIFYFLHFMKRNPVISPWKNIISYN